MNVTKLPDRPTVADGAEHVLQALDVIAFLACKDDRVDEVIASKKILQMIASRAELILGLIAARETRNRRKLQ